MFIKKKKIRAISLIEAEISYITVTWSVVGNRTPLNIKKLNKI